MATSFVDDVGNLFVEATKSGIRAVGSALKTVGDKESSPKSESLSVSSAGNEQYIYIGVAVVLAIVALKYIGK